MCVFSVGCGTSENTGQCSINCVMGTTSNCYSAASAECLVNAVAAQSCADLTQCQWIL